MLTQEEKDDLLKKANAATPGRWIHSKAPTGLWVESSENAVALVGDSFSGREEGSKNAEYIAAANPVVIRQLLGEIWWLEKQADWLAYQLSRLQDDIEDPNAKMACEWREAARMAVEGTANER